MASGELVIPDALGVVLDLDPRNDMALEVIAPLLVEDAWPQLAHELALRCIDDREDDQRPY